jgi:CBS domain-containing membrane protein
MLTATKPLTALTAADVMTRDLVLIPRQMSVRCAARLLSEACVSGAPVIDRRGVCVGVLSAMDFLRHAQREPPVCERIVAPCVCADWQVVEVERLPGEEVAEYMTADPVTAPAAAPITALARMMLDAHIHRVVIVDEEGRPVGIVSATDVLAAVARADRK